LCDERREAVLKAFLNTLDPKTQNLAGYFIKAFFDLGFTAACYCCGIAGSHRYKEGFKDGFEAAREPSGAKGCV